MYSVSQFQCFISIFHLFQRLWDEILYYIYDIKINLLLCWSLLFILIFANETVKQDTLYYPRKFFEGIRIPLPASFYQPCNFHRKHDVSIYYVR